jgi:hypothetical protein
VMMCVVILWLGSTGWAQMVSQLMGYSFRILMLVINNDDGEIDNGQLNISFEYSIYTFK